MKKYFSVPLHALIGLTVFFIAANLARFIAYDAQNWYRGYYWKKAQAEYERPFREDKIGGQTPEDVWQMFISALEENNIEKAATYFYVATRDEQKQYLQEKIEKDGRENFIKYYQDVSQKWKKEQGITNDLINFVYKTYQSKEELLTLPNGTQYKIPAGEHEGRIEFINNENNLWKLYSL